MPTKPQFYTALAALTCGCLLHALGAPLPFLFGSLGGCLLVAVLGVPMQGIPLLPTVSRTVLGVAIGVSITWELLANALTLLPTLLMVPLFM